MNIGILGATEFELKELSSFVMLHVSRFTLHVTGIGPKNAEISIKKFIKSNLPECIIICGLCGGLQNNLQIGDVIISDSFVHSTEKIEATVSQEIKKKILAIAEKLKISYYYGNTLTVEKALLTSQEKSNAGKKYSALAVEMENFPIAKVCRENNIPLISIRAISDEVIHDLDPRFFYLLDSKGNIKKRKLIKYIFIDPPFIVSLIKTGYASKKARKNYSRLIREIAGSGFEPETFGL